MTRANGKRLYGQRAIEQAELEPVPNPNVVVSFIRSDNVACCNYSSGMDGAVVSSAAGEETLELLTPPLKLVSELYMLHLLVWDQKFQKLYCAQGGSTFHVRDELLSTSFGVFHEPAQWRRLGPAATAAAHG